VRRLVSLAKWTVVYVAANQIGYLIILMLAFGDQQGGYTAYTSAFIFFQLPYAIFAVSIFTALLPALSSRWTNGDTGGFRSMLAGGVRMTGFILVPATFGYLALATPIVRLLLEHGVTGRQSSELVAQVLALFCIGLFPFAGFQLLLRAFYSMQDTRTPALINLAALATNVGANLFFFYGLDLGVRGLALGHAAGYTLAVTLATLVMRKRLGGLEGRQVTAGLSKVLLASVLTGAAAWGTLRLTEAIAGTGEAALLVQVTLAIAVGLAVYLLAAYLLRMDELKLVREAVRPRFRR
jgi:putative peptidoglycan lipid II flippase